MAIDHQRTLTKLATRRLLFGFFLLGLLLIFVDPLAGDRWPKLLREIASEMGKAFIVAAILGWAVDEALKNDLVRNAVSAALGYLLPDSLKPELGWLYDQQFIAEQIYSIRIEHFPDKNAVKFSGTYDRRIENISAEKAKIRLGGGTDEWFHPLGETTIEVCEYRRVTNGNTSETIQIPTKKSSIGIGYELLDVELAPGEIIELVMSYTMWRPDHATETLVYRYLINRPLVNVEFSKTLDVNVSFSHRDPTSGRSATGHISKRLERMLLPYQDIQVIWHRLEHVEARRQACGSKD